MTPAGMFAMAFGIAVRREWAGIAGPIPYGLYLAEYLRLLELAR